MAKAYNARCIVLKKTKLRETDAIITMLASDGRQIRAVANGVRKPGGRIGARLELFSVVDLLLHQGRTLDTVREVRSVQTNAKCRDGLERPACAHAIAELLEKMGRDGAALDERVYLMSIAAFKVIGEIPEDKGALIACAHLFKTIAMQGFAPATRQCALCGAGAEDVHAFDVSYGGMLCNDCAEKAGVRPAEGNLVSRWIDTLLRSTFEELSKVEEYPATLLIDIAQQWIGTHLSLNIKSLIFLKSIF